MSDLEHRLDLMAKVGIGAFVRGATADAATEAVVAAAQATGRHVVDLAPWYPTDLRGAAYMGGTPPVTGRAVPPWLAEVRSAATTLRAPAVRRCVR